MSDWWIVRPVPCGPSGCTLTMLPKGRMDVHSNPMVTFTCLRFRGRERLSRSGFPVRRFARGVA